MIGDSLETGCGGYCCRIIVSRSNGYDIDVKSLGSTLSKFIPVFLSYMVPPPAT